MPMQHLRSANRPLGVAFGHAQRTTACRGNEAKESSGRHLGAPSRRGPRASSPAGPSRAAPPAALPAPPEFESESKNEMMKNTNDPVGKRLQALQATHIHMNVAAVPSWPLKTCTQSARIVFSTVIGYPTSGAPAERPPRRLGAAAPGRRRGCRPPPPAAPLTPPACWIRRGHCTASAQCGVCRSAGKATWHLPPATPSCSTSGATCMLDLPQSLHCECTMRVCRSTGKPSSSRHRPPPPAAPPLPPARRSCRGYRTARCLQSVGLPAATEKCLQCLRLRCLLLSCWRASGCHLSACHLVCYLFGFTAEKDDSVCGRQSPHLRIVE